MKRIFTILLLAITLGSMAQTNSEMTTHYEKFYQQMRKQGDVQGVINALTHLNVITPKQTRIDTLAYIYTAEGRYVEALNTIGLEYKDNDSDLNVEVKAIALKSLNQPKRSLEFYQTLFNRKPSAFLAYELADLKMQIGDLDGSAKDIEYGLANAKLTDKRAFYESSQPYQVPLKAAFLYIKGLLLFNQDKENNLDAAIKLFDEALVFEPNFNIAKISKDALMARKSPPKDEN